MPKLNYNASVDVEDTPVSPISVDPNTPPGLRKRDYIPGARGIREPHERKKISGRPSGRVIKFGPDFITNKEATKKKQHHKSTIQKLAKEIWISQRSKLKDWEGACRLLNTISDEELIDPTKEIQRAQKIVARGRPITKKEAIKEATNRIMKPT